MLILLMPLKPFTISLALLVRASSALTLMPQPLSCTKKIMGNLCNAAN